MAEYENAVQLAKVPNDVLEAYKEKVMEAFKAEAVNPSPNEVSPDLSKIKAEMQKLKTELMIKKLSVGVLYGFMWAAEKAGCTADECEELFRAASKALEDLQSAAAVMGQSNYPFDLVPIMELGVTLAATLGKGGCPEEEVWADCRDLLRKAEYIAELVIEGNQPVK